MTDVISEYQKWKQQGENLKAQAKEAMESRFRELLAEAVSIAEEYRADFGVPLKPPSPVTTFRYKRSGKPRPKKASKQPKAKVAESPRAEPKAKPAETPRPAPNAQTPDPKIARLKRQLAGTHKKLEQAKAAGAPTRPLEDRIYEIEDELRLAEHPA